MLTWLNQMLWWVNMLDAQGDLFLDEVFLLQVFLFKNHFCGNWSLFSFSFSWLLDYTLQFFCILCLELFLWISPYIPVSTVPSWLRNKKVWGGDVIDRYPKYPTLVSLFLGSHHRVAGAQTTLVQWTPPILGITGKLMSLLEWFSHCTEAKM